MKISRLLRKNTAEKPPIAVTRTEALACVPEKSSAVQWTQQETDEITIEYPLQLKPFFISLSKRFAKGGEQKLTKKLQLDAIGSRVWLMIDGTTDVKTIIKEMAPATGLSLQETEIAVTTFLRELGRRGLILLK
jgi:hypothetical protein